MVFIVVAPLVCAAAHVKAAIGAHSIGTHLAGSTTVSTPASTTASTGATVTTDPNVANTLNTISDQLWWVNFNLLLIYWGTWCRK